MPVCKHIYIYIYMYMYMHVRLGVEHCAKVDQTIMPVYIHTYIYVGMSDGVWNIVQKITRSSCLHVSIYSNMYVYCM